MAKTAAESAIDKIKENYPSVNAEGQKELENVDQQFDMFERHMRALSDSMSPVRESEPQTKLSTREQNKDELPYLKPFRTIGSKEPFNEKFRAQYEYAKQYVRCIAENNEIKGETIEVWSKPYPGMACEFWKVPVNKPVMIPRYLASQINTRVYNKYSMQDRPTPVGGDGYGTYYSGIIAKETTHRLDCRPTGNIMVSMFN